MTSAYHCTLLLLILLSDCSADIWRALVDQDTSVVLVDTGTPPLQVPLLLSTVLSGVIFWDDPCAMQPLRCAPVCADEDFGPQACPPECLPEKQRRWTRDCANRDAFWDANYYNRSESTSRTEMQGEWTAQIGEYWKMKGEVLLDRLHFHDNASGADASDDTPEAFAVESALLMAGKLVNYYYFDNYVSGYLGLAPGEHNLVVQAFNRGLIPAPIVAHSPTYDGQMLYFGGLPSDAPCMEAARFQTFENKWMTRVEKMEFLGLTYAYPIVHFTYAYERVDDQRILLSDELIQRALKAGVLVVDPQEDDLYRVNCSGEVTARVTADDQTFVFPITSFKGGKSTCFLYIGRISFFGTWNKAIAYTNTPTVILPSTALNDNCFSYDYVNQTISFAKSTID